jgi:hypothetical protein
VLTAQALIGQSIVRPQGGILIAGWGIAIGAGLAAVVVLVGAARHPLQSETRPAGEQKPIAEKTEKVHS